MSDSLSVALSVVETIKRNLDEMLGELGRAMANGQPFYFLNRGLSADLCTCHPPTQFVLSIGFGDKVVDAFRESVEGIQEKLGPGTFLLERDPSKREGPRD